ITIERTREITGKGTILVVSAGTSDIPVAEEAVLTARLMGNRVEQLFDVGVAGIHRLLEHREGLTKARVIICIAGMEGALPSVVGGLVGVPVIAVPTSAGYGASFGGVAALLGMLNSCASNVTVVTIDNGFGAACGASCSGKVREMSGMGSTLPERSSAMALAKGPQREPTTVISFTTMGQVSTGAAPWKVDFSSSVPRCSVMCCASVRPVAEPVASTTRR